KRALDVTVRKQGVMNLVFHPHGWSSPEQLVALIDYAQTKYGKKVKFLNFKECAERLEKNLLKGNPLRYDGDIPFARGLSNGVRLIDLNNDGFMDVLIGNMEVGNITRIWNTKKRSWNETHRPLDKKIKKHETIFPEYDYQFGTINNGENVIAVYNSALMRAPDLTVIGAEMWMFKNDKWVKIHNQKNQNTIPTTGTGSLLRDIDNDGHCELIRAIGKRSEIWRYDSKSQTWKLLPIKLPNGVSISALNEKGEHTLVITNNGVRFIDLNNDGFDDIVFSNEKRWGIYLWETRVNPGLGWKAGWTMAREGKRGDKDAIPMISRGGKHPNNGAWFHSGHLWVQNEDTAHLPDVVDRRSFKQLLDFGGPKAKEPEESRRCFQVREGFAVQLVASEPQVRDPVAFDWGADGKLWVAEMGDYPSGTDGKGKAGGVVRWLEDADGDGRYEKSTVFLDGLNFPNGVMPWGKGVLISAAPDILYAEDTTGDGRADVRRVLFTGFREGNQQHRMNGFALGLDNWIYGANGDSGGTITSKATGRRVNISGRDFRFKVTGEFETVAGQTQFGRWRDDWGNWFGNNNPNWLWHYHVPLRYLARNPQLAVGATRRNTFSSNRCFPISAKMERPNNPQSYGHVTSANSATPY
ncbi:MAG: PVC-type heme-binding CxxCH protein, partial [Verrucomicrobiia bacterium]